MADYTAALVEFVAAHCAHIYEDETDPAKRYLLVEASRFDGALYLTSHDSPEDAATYHDTQEHPDDWPIHQFVDLETDEVIPHETTWVTTFAADADAAGRAGSEA